MSGVVQGLIGSFVSAAAPPSSNLISNPDFETATLDSGWLYYDGRTTAQANTGSWSLAAGADELGYTLIFQDNNRLTVGSVYSLSFWIKGNDNFALGNDTVNFGNTSPTFTVNVTTSWQKISVLNQTCTATKTFLLLLASTSYTQQFWVDDFVLQLGPTA